MKILYGTFYHSKFGMGGAEQVLRDLARAMKERFHEDVMCIANPGLLTLSFRESEIPVAEVPLSKMKTLQILWRLQRVISDFQPDIIHSHHRYMTFLLDLFFKRKAKIIHTQHVPAWDWRGLFRYGHLATAVHEAVRRNLIETYTVPEDCVVTIPNAVPPQVPDPKELRTLCQRYPRQKGQCFALCIARLDEQKGHRHLVEAVAELPKVYQERIKIFLAGDGVLAATLKKEVVEKGVTQQFIFLGHTNKIPEFLTLCDFLVLPSLWEGLPLSILEAYSAGKPVIATDIPGSRESVRPGETGLLVPARDATSLAKALIKFIEHPPDVAAMGGSAYDFWQEKFSFERMVSAYHELYKNLLK